nr:hypothetical protein [Cognatishimia sp. F0-27]
MLAAHETADKSALIGLYEEAAGATTDPQAAAFYLTHAYVYALELGDGRARQYHAVLKAQGREV